MLATKRRGHGADPIVQRQGHVRRPSPPLDRQTRTLYPSGLPHTPSPSSIRKSLSLGRRSWTYLQAQQLIPSPTFRRAHASSVKSRRRFAVTDLWTWMSHALLLLRLRSGASRATPGLPARADSDHRSSRHVYVDDLLHSFFPSAKRAHQLGFRHRTFGERNLTCSLNVQQLCTGVMPTAEGCDARHTLIRVQWTRQLCASTETRRHGRCPG